jgi:hypothetical protein
MTGSIFSALTLLPFAATLAFLGGEVASPSRTTPGGCRSAEDAAQLHYEQLGYPINGRQGVSVRIAETDLNNDGRKDALIHVESPDTCGTAGCDLLIASSDDTGTWTIVSMVSGTWLPVGVMPETSNGWRDIRVSVGPDAVHSHRRLRFDGRYLPEFNLITLAPVVADDDGDILLR